MGRRNFGNSHLGLGAGGASTADKRGGSDRNHVPLGVDVAAYACTCWWARIRGPFSESLMRDIAPKGPFWGHLFMDTHT